MPELTVTAAMLAAAEAKLGAASRVVKQTGDDDEYERRKQHAEQCRNELDRLYRAASDDMLLEHDSLGCRVELRRREQQVL